MDEPAFDNVEMDGPESSEISGVWNLLTPEQKKYFKKITKKNKENLSYIG